MSRKNIPQSESSCPSAAAQPRRAFLKLSGLGLLGVALLSGKTTFAEGAAKAEPLKADDPQAKALGYSPDAGGVDLKKWPKRAGPEGAKQFCYNCQFYTTKDDPKTAKTAPCTIFAGKLVNSAGWCNTWTKNPKVT